MTVCARSICVLCGTLLLGSGQSANAKDCSVSKKFTLKTPQVLSGAGEDPQRIAILLEMELLSGGASIRRVKTDHSGNFDFGEVPAGEYRLHVIYSDDGYCAPKIKCNKRGCTIKPRLEWNQKNKITVEAAGR